MHTTDRIRRFIQTDRTPRSARIPGFPVLDRPMLLDLLEFVTPLEVAKLFLLPYETVLLLTGIDFDYWTTGVVPEEGTVAFMSADPDTGLPTGCIIGVGETPDQVAVVRERLGDVGMPLTIRFKGQYAESGIG